MTKPTLIETTVQDEPTDPFDLTSLRLDQSFIETAGVKKLLTTVPVRKPGRQEFVRVHPDGQYRCDFAAIELKEDREIYVVRPEVYNELLGETIHITLYTTMTRQGVLFLWPVRLPDPDGRHNEWSRVAREAAEMAVNTWLRLQPNMQLGAYEITLAQAAIAEPKWPELSFQEILRIAFRDRIITSDDHPVIKRLRGLT